MASPVANEVFGRKGRNSKREAAKQGLMLDRFVRSSLMFPDVVMPASPGPASSTDINNAMAALSSDLQTLYDAAFEYAFELQDKIDNTSSDARNVAAMLETARRELDSNHVIDLSQAADIDFTQTTMEFSSSGGMRMQSAMLPCDSIESSIESASVDLPGKTIGIKRYGNLSTKISHTIPWILTAHASEDGRGSLNVIVKLEEPSILSRLVMLMFPVSPSDKVKVTCDVSADGKEYKRLFSSPPGTSGEFTFEPVNASHVRVVMTKLRADSYDRKRGAYVYRWIISGIALGYNRFYDNSKVTTNVISPGRAFSSVSVDVDSYTPDGTSVTIDVATGRGGSVGPWIPVEPGERLDLTARKHVSSNVAIAVRDTARAIASLGAVILSDAQFETMNVYKNVGSAGENRLVAGGSPVGWRLIPPYYTCVVSNKNEKTIDVGSNAMLIDGVTRVGRITVSPGIHTIAVNENRWTTLPPDATARDDALYPFNVRYIVEGHPNIDVYTGFDVFAGGVMERTTFFELRTGQVTDPYRYAVYDSTIWIPYTGVTDSCSTNNVVPESYRIEYVRDTYPTPDCYAVRVNAFSRDFTLTPVVKTISVDLGGRA